MSKKAPMSPAERAQDLIIGRRSAAYTVTLSEEVYLSQNVLFELSDEGWQGLNLARERLLHSMSWWPRYLTEYAKRIGLGDIAAMENSSNPEGAAQVAQGLKGKVSLHLKADPLRWTQPKAEQYISYAGALLEFLDDSRGYTPKSGSYNVTLLMTPSVQELTVDHQDSKGTILIKVPSELEPPGWGDTMKAGLMRAGQFK